MVLLRVYVQSPQFVYKFSNDTISFTFPPVFLSFTIFTCLSIFFAMLYRFIDRNRLSQHFHFWALVGVAAYLLILVSFINDKHPGGYGCYEEAAKAFLSGSSLYGNGYLYPPLWAIVMSGVFEGLSLLLVKIHLNFDSLRWEWLFYMYHASQVFIALVAFEMTIQISQRVLWIKSAEWRKGIAIGASTILFTVNQAVVLTLHTNQINFILLLSILAFLLLLNRSNMGAGLVLAFGIHLKIYPVLLLIPLFLSRRYKMVFLSTFFVLLIFVATLLLDQGPQAWMDFIHHFDQLRYETMLPDDSLYSMILHIVSTFAADYLVYRIAIIAAFMVNITLGLLFLYRQFKWQRLLNTEINHSGLEPYLDTLGFMILFSPLVWPHHLILLVPFLSTLLLTAICEQKSSTPIAIFALCLILAYPAMNHFPYNLPRVLGVLLLLWLVHPHSPTDSKCTFSDGITLVQNRKKR
jgi:hypothetical protein